MSEIDQWRERWKEQCASAEQAEAERDALQRDWFADIVDYQARITALVEALEELHQMYAHDTEIAAEAIANHGERGQQIMAVVEAVKVCDRRLWRSPSAKIRLENALAELDK